MNFSHPNSFLQIYTDTTHAGAHKCNIRDTFIKSSSATLTNSFTSYTGGSTINGEWYTDDGDLTNSKSIREPRVFCVKGKYTQSFTGTNVFVRIETDSGRGNLKVKIDGVQPTTIIGVANAINTINCDADTSLLGKGYFDVLVATNLSDTVHTIELYAENAVNVYVAVIGIKVRNRVTPVVSKKGWKAAVNTDLNTTSFSIENKTSTDIKNINITYPATIKNLLGADIVNPSTFNLTPNEIRSFNFSFDGNIPAATKNVNIGISANYLDATGNISESTTFEHTVTSSSLTFSGTGWSKDTLAPGGVWRAFTTGIGKTCTFTIPTTSFTITVQKEYGWGVANVLVNGVQYTTVTSADPVGGGFLTDITISGMAAGNKTITLSSVNGSAKPFCFTKIRYTDSVNYSNVQETLTYDFALNHIPPFVPPNTHLSNGIVKFDQPVITTDISNKAAPRSNVGVSEARVYSRFPTYCVYYGAGKLDVLAQYDLIVIEPRMMSRKEIAAFKAKGIKVLGYVSFGEEDGQRTDLFDLGSTAMGPHKDDMLGTGGYASYYNKLGNLSGESSECQHDKQRIYNVKACALSNPKYFTGTGRCSKACTKDWRDGYVTYEAGGACGGGYTKNNKWIRDAMTACSNQTCAGYTPINQKCTQWEESEVKWSQDFQSMTTFPDQNGIWSSTFINPLAPRWKEKLNTYYLPYTLGAQQEYTESHVLSSYTGATDGARLVLKLNHSPIDPDEIFKVTNSAGTHEYVDNLDFSTDPIEGIISFALDAGVADGFPVAAGQTVNVQYVRKGLECDGVFMDTVDTVDVYPSAEFQNAFANMINDLKNTWSNKKFCSNRGFSILDKIIKSCSYVMFETFISDYNFGTGVYGLITDQDSIQWNNGIKAQLRELRKKNVFDVLALNYAPNDSSGDYIREEVTKQCLAEGYLSWTSVIELNNPLPPASITLNKGKIRTNLWKIQFRKKI